MYRDIFFNHKEHINTLYGVFGAKPRVHTLTISI